MQVPDTVSKSWDVAENKRQALPSYGACILERKIIMCSSKGFKRDVQLRHGRDGLLVCG